MAADVPAAPGRPEARALAAGRPGYWVPLLLFGGLIALALPLSWTGSFADQTTAGLFYQGAYPTMTRAMYLGSGFPLGPSTHLTGWNWVAALLAGTLLTTAWYRWRDRRTGSSTRLRGYLVTGLVLAAVTAALPLAAWGLPFDAQPAWAWLDTLWLLGTFALLAVGAGLGLVARSVRSRALAVVTVLYVIAVGLAGVLDLLPAWGQPVPPVPLSPDADPAVALPAAVLLLAGLGGLLAAGLRRRQARRRFPA